MGVFSTVAVILLLTTAVQSATVTNSSLQTTAATLLTTQLNNSTVEKPLVLGLHRSCEAEHPLYCQNGGKCIYPQDSDKPSCICSSSYKGPRCFFYSQPTRSLPELEELIGIIIGVLLLLVFLALLIYFFVTRRCRKSTPLIKSAPSETSV